MSSSEQPETNRKSSGLALTIWLLSGLLLCYPLSIGPVARFCNNGRPVPPAVRAFYAPLGVLYERSDAVKTALDWYAKLWGVDL